MTWHDAAELMTGVALLVLGLAAVTGSVVSARLARRVRAVEAAIAALAPQAPPRSYAEEHGLWWEAR